MLQLAATSADSSSATSLRGTLRLYFDAPLPVAARLGAGFQVRVALRNEEGIAVGAGTAAAGDRGAPSFELCVEALQTSATIGSWDACASGGSAAVSVRAVTTPQRPLLGQTGSVGFTVELAAAAAAGAGTPPRSFTVVLRVSCSTVEAAESLPIQVSESSGSNSGSAAGADGAVAGGGCGHGGAAADLTFDDVACTVRRRTYGGSGERSRLEVKSVESPGLGGFFGVEWDCAVALASHIAAHPQLVAGKRILELGAGVGSMSALCALLGAAQVVATDLEDMLALTARTLRANGVACEHSAAGGGVAAQSKGGGTPVQLVPYKWGDPLGHLSPPFELVLASDVLFDPAEWGPLMDTLTAAAAGTVLLAHRTRNAQEVLFFEQWLPGAFTWDRLAGGGGDVELYRLTRTAQQRSQGQRAW